MNELIIHASQTPGVVTFENYEEVKSSLQTYINDTFANVDYESEGFEVASADYEELKKMRDVVTKKQKELEPQMKWKQAEDSEKEKPEPKPQSGWGNVKLRM